MNFGNIDNLPFILSFSGVLVLVFLFYSYRRRMIMKRAFFKRNIRVLDGGRSERYGLIKELCVFFAIIFAVFALLAPQWGERTREIKKEGTDLLVVLDVSFSMYATDIKTTRLERAKNAIRLIVDSMNRDRVGLVLFAGSAFIQCPLTTDLGAFSLFLDYASPASLKLQGTDIGKALDVAARVFEKKRTQSKMLLLITDGEDHEENVEPAVKKMKELGVAVYTAGIGSSSGGFITLNDGKGDFLLKDRNGEPVRTKVNIDLLKKISSDTGGKYIDLNTSLSGVEVVISALRGENRSDFGSRIIKEQEERFYIPAFIFLILLIVELALTDRKKGTRV
jgi:Ca-activated chloride channel homolog